MYADMMTELKKMAAQVDALEIESKDAAENLESSVTIPVDLSVNRHYRIYVTVKDCAGSADVRAAVLKYIETNGLDDTDLDLEIPEIEENDINGFVPDWDGAWSADKEGAHGE